MKNFRKVLALVLVVATLFSFTAMAGAYNDDKAVDANYDTAVDVLSAIGILNGYPDGSFKPTNTITRAEMAKMIAVLSNAGDDVSELYATACDFADAKNNWAASYIAYCAKTGIVAGRSASTFDPEGKVTGLETAKMLLVVLGLDPVKQGYVGSDWKVNVLRDAKEFGLLTGFSKGYKIDSNITREQAANMMLNALKAPMVIGYISDNLVTITNKIVAEKEHIKVINNITLTDAKKNGWTILYGNVVVSTTTLGSIYKGLTMEPALDCYGRPGFVWIYKNIKGKEILNSFYPDMPVKTYTTEATLAADLKDELNATGKDYKYTFHVVEDGTEVSDDIKDAYTGNGVITELYVNDATRQVYVVIINTYIGQVADVSARHNRFDIVDKNGNVIYNDQPNSYGFANGQMVLYWTCNGRITVLDAKGNVAREIAVHGNSTLHNAVVAEPVTAYVSYAKWNQHRPSNIKNAGIIADGKEKAYAYNFGNEFDTDMEAMTDKNVKAKWNIYYDLNGYIMYWTPVVEAVKYEYAYFVENTWSKREVEHVQNDTIYDCDADMVNFEAAYNKDVKVDVPMTAAMSYNWNGTANALHAGLLAKYTVDGNGVAKFVDDADFIANGLNAKLRANNPEIIKDVLYGNNATKYLLRTWNFAKAEYEYKAWTGFRNIDKNYETDNLGKTTYIQYFDENNDEIAEYVFIDAKYTNANDMFYIMGDVEDYTAAWDEIVDVYANYKVYAALINGEKSLVCYDEDAYTGAFELKPGLYKGTVVALGVNLTVEGGDYPLYLLAGEVPAEPVAGLDVAVEVKDGIVQLAKVNKDTGKLEYIYSKAISKDGLTVVNIVVNANGTFSSVKIDKDYIDPEYPIDKVGHTWIIEDAAGEVATIIREVN